MGRGKTEPLDLTDGATSAATAGGAPPRRRALRVFAGVVLTLLVAGLVALAAVSVVVPRALGAEPLTVLSGSMEPALSRGDLVVSRPVAAEDIRTGDVITVQPEAGHPTLVTQRVVGVTTGVDGMTGFVTRGDAHSATGEPIGADQVTGRVVYSVPLVGHITNTDWGLPLVGAAAVGLLVYGLVRLAYADHTSNRTTNDARSGALPALQPDRRHSRDAA